VRALGFWLVRVMHSGTSCKTCLLRRFFSPLLSSPLLSSPPPSPHPPCPLPPASRLDSTSFSPRGLLAASPRERGNGGTRVRDPRARSTAGPDDLRVLFIAGPVRATGPPFPRAVSRFTCEPRRHPNRFRRGGLMRL